MTKYPCELDQFLDKYEFLGAHVRVFASRLLRGLSATTQKVVLKSYSSTSTSLLVTTQYILHKITNTIKKVPAKLRALVLINVKVLDKKLI